MNPQRCLQIRKWFESHPNMIAIRQYRQRYIRRARRWVEASPARIDDLARRLLEIGAYSGKPDATGSRRAVRYTILRQWCKADGGNDPRCYGWHSWYSSRGWRVYDWMPVDVPNPRRKKPDEPLSCGSGHSGAAVVAGSRQV